jgi:6-pyruvoyltetrahydropterin/6-carboxytetrahydropterin synthase
MKQLRVTKEFTMETAHALDHHDGKCRNIHGHSYQLSVTVIGTPSDNWGDPKDGMVVDFADLKSIVNAQVIDRFDHALVLRKNSPFVEKLNTDINPRLLLVDYTPTCENMLLEMVKRIGAALPAGVDLHSARLRETATSFTEWFGSDNQ